MAFGLSRKDRYEVHTIEIPASEIQEGMVFMAVNGITYIVGEIRTQNGLIFIEGKTSSQNHADGWFTNKSYNVISITTSRKCEYTRLSMTNNGDTLIDVDGSILTVQNGWADGSRTCRAKHDNRERRIKYINVIRLTDKYQDNSIPAMLEEQLGVKVKETGHILDPLFQRLGLKREYSKKVIAALVMNWLITNGMYVGVTSVAQVKQELCTGLCDLYEFNVICLAVTWTSDILQTLQDFDPGLKNININSNVDFGSTYVYPFLQEHSIPGVIFKRGEQQ